MLLYHKRILFGGAQARGPDAADGAAKGAGDIFADERPDSWWQVKKVDKLRFIALLSWGTSNSKFRLFFFVENQL